MFYDFKRGLLLVCNKMSFFFFLHFSLFIFYYWTQFKSCFHHVSFMMCAGSFCCRTQILQTHTFSGKNIKYILNLNYVLNLQWKPCILIMITVISHQTDQKLETQSPANAVQKNMIAAIRYIWFSPHNYCDLKNLWLQYYCNIYTFIENIMLRVNFFLTTFIVCFVLFLLCFNNTVGGGESVSPSLSKRFKKGTIILNEFLFYFMAESNQH